MRCGSTSTAPGTAVRGPRRHAADGTVVSAGIPTSSAADRLRALPNDRQRPGRRRGRADRHPADGRPREEQGRCAPLPEVRRSSTANAKLAKSLGSFPTNKFAPVAGTVLDLSSYKVLTDAGQPRAGLRPRRAGRHGLAGHQGLPGFLRQARQDVRGDEPPGRRPAPPMRPWPTPPATQSGAARTEPPREAADRTLSAAPSQHGVSSTKGLP